MSPRSKKLLRIAIVAGVVVFVGMQLVPVKHIGENPPDRFKMDAPPEVLAIMKRACFDCHTNETRWPIYTRVAPGSWLMARDVHNGREHMNFSEWGDADESTRRTDLENAWEQVEEGHMPPWFYIYPLHLDARLSDSDKATLKSYFLKDAGKPKEGDKAQKDKTEEKPAAKP
jgi:Haem-binding domain